MPPGVILFEDPPAHDLHRGLLSRVFTPKRMLAIEPQVRAFCAASLDPLVDEGRFDFIGDLGAQMPMKTIGMLLGIPEADQSEIRDGIDAQMRLRGGSGPEVATEVDFDAVDGSGFAAYIDWRAEHPSDDLMTDLLNAEFEDETGTLRRLTRDEVLNYVWLIAAAGNETTTRLIGWAGKVLAENPDQRRAARRRPDPDPRGRRGAAALRVALARPGPLRDQRRRAPRPNGGGGQRDAAHQRLRQPRRAQVPRPRPLRHPPRDRPPPGVRLRHPLLPRRHAGPSRRADRAGGGPGAVSRRGTWTGTTPSGPTPRPCGAGSRSRSKRRRERARQLPAARPGQRRRVRRPRPGPDGHLPQLGGHELRDEQHRLVHGLHVRRAPAGRAAGHDPGSAVVGAPGRLAAVPAERRARARPERSAGTGPLRGGVPAAPRRARRRPRRRLRSASWSS